MEIPCVAIGGITVENCRPLVAAGADFLAVASGVWNHRRSPEAAVRGFNAIFADSSMGLSRETTRSLTGAMLWSLVFGRESWITNPWRMASGNSINCYWIPP